MKNNPRCLVCGTKVVSALNFETQPLANSLLKTRSESFSEYPLGFSYCPKCSHGQLSEFVAPEILFDEYLYASGTSNTLRSYFRWFARKLKYEYGGGLKILELASNDGSLLDELVLEGYAPTGLDPAMNLCKIAEKKGHKIHCNYFPASELKEKFDCIIAMNVMAHNPDPSNFMAGIAECLNRTGVAIIQTSQATMIQSGEFDTIYHEHYSFFTLESMKQLALNHGLKLEKVELTSVHGNSMVSYLHHQDATVTPVPEFKDKQFHVSIESIAFMSKLRGEEQIRRAYGAYISVAMQRMTEVRTTIQRHRDDGFKIALVGVAAKALTFVGAAALQFDGSFDEAPLKIGRFIPKFDHTIQDFDKLSELGESVLAVVGAWNFATEISEKVRKANPETKLVFLKYFPTLETFSV